MKEKTAEYLKNGMGILGIEFGSTRIKAVIIGEDFAPIASGSHTWSDSLENGIWTYSNSQILEGLADCYRDLKESVLKEFGVTLTGFRAIGISAMMHGYIPFDRDGNQLASFRTWRNTITGPAADELSRLFNFNIPQRWSIAHIYQAVLNREPHVPSLYMVNTLEGYVHRLLTGENVLGVGEASGMFPVVIENGECSYDPAMIEKFRALPAVAELPWDILDLLPAIAKTGCCAGKLTESGALLLDPAGDLKPGVPFCPPEGDVQTGMAATNTLRPGTGSVSAGTSIFSMTVMDKPLAHYHMEIDVTATPTGLPVAMVHCNTCTSDLNAWMELFADAMRACGFEPDMGMLYTNLFNKALEADKDCGGLVSFNCYSGEPVAAIEGGCPMFVRSASDPLTLPNFMRALISSSMAPLKLGMDILASENVRIEKMLGHGGLFKTKDVAQSILAAALQVPVSLMSTAGEGGPWGMSLLAAYMAERKENESLEEFLENRVFADSEIYTVYPDSGDVEGFEKFAKAYKELIPVENSAAAKVN